MSDLEKAIATIREKCPEYVKEWGSCEVTVGPKNPLAVHGIRKVDDILIHVEYGVKFMDTTESGKPDIELDGPLVHFHKDDHSMFGSKAGNSDDPDDWPSGDDEDGWEFDE